MSYVVNWAGIGDTPFRVLAIGRDPVVGSSDAANAGTFLSATEVKLCSVAAVTAADSFINGVAISPYGAIRVLMVAEADGLPAGTQWSRGLPVSSTGQLICSDDAVIDHYVHGWPVSEVGMVCTDTVGSVSAPGAFNFDLPSVDDGEVTLTWSASTDVTAYTIYRDDVLVGTTPAGTETFIDNVAAGIYTYTLFACNSTGCTASTPPSRDIGVVGFRVTYNGSFRITSDGDFRVVG